MSSVIDSSVIERRGMLSRRHDDRVLRSRLAEVDAFLARTDEDRRGVRDGRAGHPVDVQLVAELVAAVLGRTQDERRAPGGGVDRVGLTVHRDLADLRAARGHQVVARAVVDIERPATDLPERLEAMLAVDELDVVSLRALEQVAEPAAEGAGPAIRAGAALGAGPLDDLRGPAPGRAQPGWQDHTEAVRGGRKKGVGLADPRTTHAELGRGELRCPECRRSVVGCGRTEFVPALEQTESSLATLNCPRGRTMLSIRLVAAVSSAAGRSGRRSAQSQRTSANTTARASTRTRPQSPWMPRGANPPRDPGHLRSTLGRRRYGLVRMQYRQGGSLATTVTSCRTAKGARGAGAVASSAEL